MLKIKELRYHLSRVFDDDIKTNQWHNVADYIIIGLIVLSTLQVFLSTFNLSNEVEKALVWIDIITQIVFTVEVALRIWCADLIDAEYSGLWGRVKYCFSFYGFIDIISTYVFYIAWLVPIPISMLKALRVVRLLRVIRYMRSFRLLKSAIVSKKNELFVSLQFLIIITLLFSFILFFYENKAQPEVYNNGFVSVVWAFAQYIGDPGGFAETPPVTFAGRIIACFIGVLGIAIFAVPAGLIGAGFTEAVEEETHKKKVQNNIHSIIHSFKFEKDQQRTGLFVVPIYKDLNTILTRKYMSIEDIIEAVKESDNLRLYNIANAVNAVDQIEDKIVVINLKKNTPYGCCIDRGSKITIVSTSGVVEPVTTWFAYHIAKIGGFNFISKDIEHDANYPISYYNIESVVACPNLPSFIEDLNRLSSRSGSWVIPVLGAIGSKSRPSQFHFCYNSAKHDDSYNDKESRVKDYEKFDKLYNLLSVQLDEKFGYKCDKNEWYAISKKNIAHYINAENVFTLRVEMYVWMIDNRYVDIIKTVSDGLNEVLEPEVAKVLPPEMVKRIVGKDFGMDDYID